MERRFVLFLVLSFAILLGHAALMGRLRPRQQPGAKAPQGEPAAQGDRGKAEPKKKEANDRQPKPEPEQPHKAPKGPPKPADLEGPKTVARTWGTLGSADPDDPYRMLVVWDNRGAAVTRVELNSAGYHDLEDRSGYLGHLVVDKGAIGKDDRGKGCPAQVVGPGTPAAAAGLKAGDLIRALGEQKIRGVEDLRAALETTKPRAQLTLTVVRDQKEITREVTLRRRPLEVIRPEGSDPPSFLLTLQQVKGEDIGTQVLARDDHDESLDVGEELAGVDLWTGNWEVREADQTHVVFGRVLPKWGLEITKSYRLAKVPAESIGDANYKAYHLVLDVKIRNVGELERMVAYQLDGPTGLPAEGAWYAYKISRKWFQAVGLRDVVVSFDGAMPGLIGCPKIADDKVGGLPWQGQPLSYIGVDAQYFSCVLLPQKGDRSVVLPPTEDPSELWFAQSQPLRVGAVDEKRRNLTDTSCRLVSQVYRLAPGGKPDDTLLHRFVIFAGPKKPDVLAQYDGLSELIYYGWFGAIARPMSGILHFFHRIVGNYGLAILMLTILVRGCMFPLSRKQALGAQKMQELQPEIKRLQEKYKNDMEGRTRAQQELFRKHNYNPFSGCLVLFVQLPVFVALYRSLMVDIELRQAPLISQSIRWCSNLAAPDMLFDWSGFMPDFVTSGRGVFGLGPYFNILPVLTVVLFIAQQKMFMPPAADEKTAQQQKLMQYMMVFIGLLFFKVASGLCMYFIASSLWGLAERKLLPKTSAATPPAKPATRAEAKARDKPRPKPAPPPSLSGPDGAAARKKRAKRRRK
jgi:YidC/Oxa1 family membrane protein insertase